MVISLKDKILLNGALDTEIARVKRAINSEKTQAIKEIHGAMLADLQGLLGRVVNEVAK